MNEGLSARTLKVIRCASRLHRRVTASDVAMSTGLSLDDAESELVRLTSKVNGHLEVSKSGDIVYAFPLGFRQALVLDPIESAVRNAVTRVVNAFWWMFKMYFGSMLIISICILFLVVCLVFLRFFENVDFNIGSFGGGGGSDKNSKGKKQKKLKKGDKDATAIGMANKKADPAKASEGASGEVQEDEDVISGESSAISVSTPAADTIGRKNPAHADEFSKLRYRYLHKLAEVEQLEAAALSATAEIAPFSRPAGVAVPDFFKEVFSYLFGDANPNQYLEEERWARIAQLIVARNGVLTAEELAPFVDVDPSKLDDERFVLPVLARYKGRARLSESGHIIYVFEPSNVSAVTNASVVAPPAFLQERQWTITYPAHVAVLAMVNVGLAIFAVPMSLALGAIWLPITLLLFLNALFFVGLNLAAKSRTALENMRVDARNESRLQCIRLLLDPAKDIDSKLKEANQFRSQKLVVSEKDIVYRTDADLVEQAFEMKAGSEAEGRIEGGAGSELAARSEVGEKNERKSVSEARPEFRSKSKSETNSDSDSDSDFYSDSDSDSKSNAKLQTDTAWSSGESDLLEEEFLRLENVLLTEKEHVLRVPDEAAKEKHVLHATDESAKEKEKVERRRN